MDTTVNSSLTEHQESSNKSGITYSNVFDKSNHDNYNFRTIKSAPIYRPTEEEFKLGPLNYIAKIRDEVEKFGLCKIIPPKSFQTPFTLDVDNFRFTPRIQRLNELEAQTRVRLSFLEKLIKYWSLQGHQIKIPSIDKKILDLYQLHKVVEKEGGFETCVKDRKWSIVASKMGFQFTPQSKGTIASLLRHHYEKLLFPFDLFSNGTTYDENSLEDNNLTKEGEEESTTMEVNEVNESMNEDKNQIEFKTESIKVEHNESGKQSNGERDKMMEIDQTKLDRPPARTSTRQRLQGQSLCNVKLQNKELAKLQVYGPGPKMPGFSSNDSTEPFSTDNKNSNSSLPHCVQCGDNTNQFQLVICSTCKNNFHIKCLIPPLYEVPKNIQWNCPRCIAYLVQKQPSFIQEFGFVQSPRTYSLTEFGEIADKFKSDYFNMPCQAVPIELIEKEFWRLVSSMEDSVAVEYGADLHTTHSGSGFPTHKNPKLLPSDLEYVDHPWNLNNLPILEGSVFKYINTNISGMIVPWNYIGMCFSTFCWHNEDHWSYSINYLHWGQNKFWYGVPGSAADKFEDAMKSVAPELFKSQPDLLHQLVTICNPNVLQNYDVPIYSMNQAAGEFVVTYPRSYHCGFNSGLNFAEAVNFAPSDWLPIGRKCIQAYSELKRYPVFSHDELVCKMANDPDILDISIAETTYLDLLEMVEQEKIAREHVLEMGIMKSARETFELLPDDERQCDYCKTTCFLSGVNCECSDVKLVCLKHVDKLCSICKFEQMTLRYRYTLDELPLMLNKMEKRKNEYKEWSDWIDKQNSNSSHTDKATLQDFRRHIYEARIKNYPKDTEKFLKLKDTIEHAARLSKTAKEILDQQKTLDDLNEQIAKSNRLKNDLRKAYQRPIKKRTEEQSVVLRSAKSKNKSKEQEEENTKLDFSEFKQFIDEINYLPCQIPETDLINQLHNRCDTIKKSIEEITNYTKEESEGLSSDFIEQLIFEANCISIVDFDQQLDIVKYKLDEIKWIEKCKVFLNSQEDNRKKKHQIELPILDTMIDSSKELLVSTHISQKLILQLQTLREQAENWIVKAKDLIDLPVQLDDSNHEFDVNLYEKLPTFGEFQILVKEAEEDADLVKINLNPHLDKLQKIITNTDDWLENYKKLFPDELTEQYQPPFFDQIEDLFNSGKELGCKMKQMTKLYSIYVTFKNWREKLYKHFIKKNSIYTLLNVLLPRTKNSVPQSVDLVNMSSKVLFQQLKKVYFQQSIKDHNKVDWFKKQLDSKMSRESIEKTYKEAIRSEEICMKEIREKNLIKLHSTNFAENSNTTAIPEKLTDQETEDDICDKNFDIKKKKFCICGKKPADLMISCFLCNEFYHKSCLKMKKPNNNQQLNDSSQDLEKDNSFYLCILCSRSKRPNLDLVINLSEQLNNQKIRILENELLRCLIVRANYFKYSLQKELNARSDLREAYNLVVKAVNGLLDLNENDSVKKRKTGQQQQQNNLAKKLNLKINLSDQTKNVLYNLIWDLSLLQVSINEFKYLWEIYCLTNPEFKSSVFVTPEITNFTLPITNTYLEYKLNEFKEQPEKKRKASVISEQQQLKSSKKATNKKQKKSSAKDLNSSTNSSSSETEVCSLNEKCLRPSNKEINWIYCETKDHWLHFQCAGIDSSVEINEIDKFYCAECLKNDEQDKNADLKNEKSTESQLTDNSSLEKQNSNDQIDPVEAAESILCLGQDIEQSSDHIQIKTADNLNND